MSKKRRLFLFIVCVLLFLVLSPIAIFYSQGYRFDPQKRRITQTGGFYVKASPARADVYLNDNLKKKTDFFFGAVLIENLLPEKYKLEVKKDGYYSWSKTLEIKEKLVTENKNIFLVPQNVSPFEISENTEDLFLSPDETKLILYEDEKGQDKGRWSLKLYDIQNKVKSLILSERDISKTNIDFLDLSFSPDSKNVLIRTSLNEQIQYFLLSLTSNPPSFLSLRFLGQNIDFLSFNGDEAKVFGLKDGLLFQANLDKKQSSLVSFTEKELKSSILVYKEHKNNIYFLNKGGYIFKTNSSFKNEEILNKENPLPKSDGEIEYGLYLLNSYIFVKQGTDLYLFKEKEGTFTKEFDNTFGVVISPNSKRMIYYSPHEISVISRDKEANVGGVEEEKQFILRISPEIRQVLFLNDYYLVFNTEDEINIIETDARDEVNNITFVQTKNSKVIWSNLLKNLFVLANNNLSSYELKNF